MPASRRCDKIPCHGLDRGGGLFSCRPDRLSRRPGELKLLILGLETSCDETAAALLETGDGETRVLADVISSQADFFSDYGGVVPELASRNHAARLLPVVRRVLTEAGRDYADLDAVAATYGPGLTGALLVGLNFGKALAWGLGIPFVGVNHLAAHLQAPLLAEGAPGPPFVGLLVSGGHTALYEVRESPDHPGLLEFSLLGETVDDAVGEAYDKVGRLLGVPYPAGPVLDRWSAEYAARPGAPAEELPRPMPDGLDFSFAGLKTAAARRISEVEAAGELDDDRRRALAAGFQRAAVETLTAKALAACAVRGIPSLIVGGGVAANAGLREHLGRLAGQRSIEVFFAPMRLCTDNAVMIAARGRHLLEAGRRDDLDLEAVACLEL